MNRIKAIKSGLCSLIQFARVCSTLAACVWGCSELPPTSSAVWRETGAQLTRLLIALLPELSFTQFCMSVAYYGGQACTALLSCHLRGSAFLAAGSCLESLNRAAPRLCLDPARLAPSMKSLADLARDLWCESRNVWLCKGSFPSEVLSPSSANWKSIAAEITGLFNLWRISLYQVRLGPCKEL